MKRPESMVYWINERPAFIVAVLMGLQHIFIMSIALVFPVVIVQDIGGTMEQVTGMVSLSMIAAGLGTILQALRLGPMGSGYLCPNVCGPSYLSVSMQAAWLGGLPLLHGMTLVAGAFEMLLSRFVHRLRFLFPTEITGLVVMMVAVTLIPLSTSKAMGVAFSGDAIEPMNAVVSLCTLMAMIGLNVWTRGKLKVYCVLIGMIFGYLLSAAVGIFTLDELNALHRAPLFAMPGQGIELFTYSFDWSLVPPFIIVSLCASLKSMGNLVTCQRINDDDWKEPDMRNIGRGLLADGLGIFAGGAMGGMAVDTSASNVGLTAATSATSRHIAYTTGGIFILLAFLPKLATLFSVMPTPVMGATLVFSTAFMAMTGMKIIGSGAPDQRMAFTIGISFIFGLSVVIIPEMYHSVHPWLRPVFSSGLTLATVTAIILNQLFRLGRREER